MAAATSTYITKMHIRRSTPSLQRPNHAHGADGTNHSTKTGREEAQEGRAKKDPSPNPNSLTRWLRSSAVVSLMSELLNALDGRVGRSVGFVALMPHLRVWIWLPTPIQSRECV